MGQAMQCMLFGQLLSFRAVDRAIDRVALLGEAHAQHLDQPPIIFDEQQAHQEVPYS
jgi:hypothetical protein